MHAGQLFSEHFLTDGIRTTEAYRRLTSDPSFIPGIRRRLEEVYQQFPFQASPDEAQTEQDLIFRVLEAVGWNRDMWIVQARAARKGRSDVPDMLLFSDADAKQKSERRAREGQSAIGHGVAIVENKRWDRPLDRATQGARKGEEEREVPSSQILRYLSRAETLSDRRIQWAILTNGRLWRLYYQGAKSRSEEYLEIDLSRLLDVPGLSDLLTERERRMRAPIGFACSCSCSAVHRSMSRATVAFTSSLWTKESCGRSRSPRVSRTWCSAASFRDLVASLDAANPRQPSPRTQEYLRELKDAALMLLYRLLFVLYAEDRDLLPVRDARYDNYGLRADQGRR